MEVSRARMKAAKQRAARAAHKRSAHSHAELACMLAAQTWPAGLYRAAPGAWQPGTGDTLTPFYQNITGKVTVTDTVQTGNGSPELQARAHAPSEQWRS